MKVILTGAFIGATVVALALASQASANADTCVRKTIKLDPIVSATISGCDLEWWGAYVVPGKANKGGGSNTTKPKPTVVETDDT
jgi:hypothetical protein